LVFSPLIIIKRRVDVDEVQVLELLLGIGFHLNQPPDRLGIDFDLAPRGVLHVGQVQPCRHQVVAVAVVLVGQLTQGAAQIAEVEAGILISAQVQVLGHTFRSAQEDDDRDTRSVSISSARSRQ